jgi:hypothetical protein
MRFECHWMRVYALCVFSAGFSSQNLCYKSPLTATRVTARNRTAQTINQQQTL